MGITKYTRAESGGIVSPPGHKAIEEELHKLGKTSARELSDDQRDRIRTVVDQSESQ